MDGSLLLLAYKLVLNKADVESEITQHLASSTPAFISMTSLSCWRGFSPLPSHHRHCSLT